MNKDISLFLPYYPLSNSKQFNALVNQKAEFRTPSVPATEFFPSEKGDLMTHQRIISRIMSSHTPYDSILLMHEMGTGKTCSSVAIMEQIRSENNGFSKFIFVCGSDSLRANFEAEFRGVCTKGDYEDVPLRKLGIRTMTYGTFLKTFSGNAAISLNDTVVVIDEAHNIKESYKKYRPILTSPDNIKVILMSGTPMTDDPSGIAKVMNMIIKDDEDQLDTTPDFYKDLTPDKVAILRAAFKGRISYIKSMSTNEVTKEFVTNPALQVPVFNHFKLHASEMSPEQTSKYMDVFNSDTVKNPSDDDRIILKDSASAAYSNSLQASNFVGEDGQYTKDGFATTKFNLNLGTGNTTREKLARLRKYSAKYADSVQAIIESRAMKKNVFVFNLYVNGGGLMMFAKILNAFGFQSVSNRSVKNLTPGSERFILLTGNPKIDKKLLIERFNRPDNVNGDYIGVVLASDAISEGYTFKNVQHIDIHSPWFQFAKTTQAIARGIRFGSHRELLKTQSSVNVEIYLRASVVRGENFEDPSSSVDVIAYKIAEEKDVVVKRIERLIKEEAIDALINVNRNRRVGMDKQRECDYMDCEYEPFPTERLSDKDRDYSTFELYYGANDEVLTESILRLFSINKSLTFDYIVANTNSSKLPVVSSLCNIITASTPVEHKGNTYYLRETNDVYYLTNEISNYSTLFDLYYLNNMVGVLPPQPIEEEGFNVETILSDPEVNGEVSLVTAFENNLVSIADKEVLIEKVALGGTPETPQTKAIRTVFGGLFGEIDGVLYSWYQTHAGPSKKLLPSRVYRSGVWSNATPGDDLVIRNYLNGLKEKAISVVSEHATDLGKFEPPYYYGLKAFNDSKVIKGEVETFKIFTYDPSIKEKGDKDARGLPKGQACNTFGGREDVFLKLGIARKEIPGKVADQCKSIQTAMMYLGVVIRDVKNIK